MSSKALSVCSKVGQPSEASASALAKRFGNSSKPGSSRKRSFDPTSECVVASQRCKRSIKMKHTFSQTSAVKVWAIMPLY